MLENSGEKVKQDKRARRLLTHTARRAAFELERLREIREKEPIFDYFYEVMESVFVRNDPERFLNPRSEKKKMIGVYCMMVPEELIYAVDAVPVRLCSGCFESSQTGQDCVPRDGCPLVKSSMGFSMQGGLGVFDMCDVVIVPTTCDAKRKFAEELSAFKEVWVIEVPHIKDAEFSRRMWMEQMFALKGKLEKYTSNGWSKKKITARKLESAVGNSAKAQWETRKLLSMRQRAAPVIWGREAVTVMNAYAYTTVTDWSNAVADLNTRLAKKERSGEFICSRERPRVFIAGSPSIFPNLKIPALVEEMGGIVVCDESCAGDRYLYDPVGSTEINLRDQLAAIASRYMAPCVCPSFAPNEDRLTMIRRSVGDFAVDGVLYHVLKGCVIYDFEVRRVEKALQEASVPLLRIETDYNPEDIEQLRTRIEAFMEMLKTKKKTAGLERT